MNEIPRRELISIIARLGAASLLPGVVPGGATAPPVVPSKWARPELIPNENAKQGTRDWLLENPRIDASAKYRCPWIEGYFSHSSVRAGEAVTLYVSTNPPSRFVVELYRMGYYGGQGARRMMTLGPFSGAIQPDPPVGENRLRVCRWRPATTFRIPPSWPSGVYLAKLRARQEGVESYAILIVKDNRECDFIFQCSDTTWQAYNRWPSQYSLYDNGESQWYWGAGVEVSFDRPYGRYCQLGEPPLSTGSGEFLLWEFPLAYWMESQGCDLSYVSNLDTHSDPAGLRRAKGFLSVGHDEYYSLEMFWNLKNAVASGLNVAFLSGNACCGLISVRDAFDRRSGRIISRIDRFGPRDEKGDSTFVAMKTLPRSAPNESLLIGARSTGPIVGGAAWTCTKPSHWIFEGTGMKEGDGIAGLVGWEFHGEPAQIPGLEVVASGKTRSSAGEGVYTATVYPVPKGNFVFNAATCWWSDGLSEPPGYFRPKAYEKRFGPDARVQRITANVLGRMRGK